MPLTDEQIRAAMAAYNDALDVQNPAMDYEATRAALEAAEAAAWRSIETAPKDTVVLLGWWELWPEKQFVQYADTAVMTEDWWRHPRATHWRPLPAAPKSGGE